MIQGDWKEYRHVSWTEHGRNLGGGVEWIIGKNNKNNKNDGSGSRAMHGLQAELLQKFWKHREVLGSTGKYWEAPRSTGKHWEGAGSPIKGREHEILPRNASARVCECYRM